MDTYENTNIPKNQNVIKAPNLILAAIYLSAVPTEFREKLNIADQVEACNKFIEKRGWRFSGDLFLQRGEQAYIGGLARARALVKKFDYLVSFVNFFPRGKSYSEEIKGMIVCIDAQLYAKWEVQIYA